MSQSKLKTIHVIIIGILACVIVVAGLYFTVIKKRNESIAALQEQYRQHESKYNEKASWEAKLVEAQEKNRLVSAQYEKYLEEKMPAVSFEDRTQGMIALWKEQGQVLGPLLQSWPGKTGVSLVSSIQVPAAPVNPNAIDTSLIKIPIGTFQVRGDFRSILAHVRSWNKFNRLVQIDPLSLTGPSPGMTGQYAVTVYIFPRGEVGPTITMAGGGSGDAGINGIVPPMPTSGAPAPAVDTGGPMMDRPPTM